MRPLRPSLLSLPPEPFLGWVNVHEVPGELGGTLMVLYRHVLLWAETPPAERASLYPPSSASVLPAQLDTLIDLPETLASALRALCAVRDAPGEVRAAEVSRACDELSAWAEEAGHLGTAIAWARAAATAYPANVAAAYRVGILARRRAEYPTAEAWLQQAAGLARRHGDWYAYVLALNSWGNLYTQRGEFARAAALLDKAVRAARRPRGRIQGGRKRLRRLEADILHDRMTVAMYREDYAGAERFAAEAFERMRSGHGRLPMLAHDVALLWMERGYFARALPVFEAVRPHFTNARERLLLCCNLARCAGVEGQADLYARTAAEVWDLIRGAAPGTTPAGVYTNLARGAAGLRRWEDAEAVAMLAAEAAAAREEADQTAVIPALLESIRLHRFADVSPQPASPLEERAARSLAAGLVESLQVRRAGD